MNHSEFALKTKDGLTLYSQAWQPDTAPRAVICLIHGLGEHSGRYAHVAEAFNNAGLALAAMDLRGHGKSEGKRGHTPIYESFLDDIDLLLAFAVQRYPGAPRFLYGHSLGGNLVLYYALLRQPAIHGVIASAALLRTSFAPPAWKVPLGKMMNRIWPDFIMPNGLEQAALSRDPAVVQAYQRDPLVHDRISARLGIGFMQAGEYILNHASDFPPVPLLVMQGMDDRIVSAEANRQVASGVKGDVTFKPWDKLYHEIHNEPEKQMVLDFVISWINTHI
jgi:acylglycerol lipase